jgi:hypothetical protein
MKNIFTSHPQSVGESYFQHFKFASYAGMQMLLGGFACLIHAIFPFVFKSTGSTILLKMAHHFIDRMPYGETSIIHLSRLIERKVSNSPLNMSREANG